MNKKLYEKLKTLNEEPMAPVKPSPIAPTRPSPTPTRKKHPLKPEPGVNPRPKAKNKDVELFVKARKNKEA